MKQYSQTSLYKTEEEEPYQPSLAIRRFVVVALYLSFLACLAAFWLTGTVFGGLNQILPFWFMGSIQSNRTAILIFPLASLFACYITLCYITKNMLASPDRYLDERQKMLRDRAHRSAYGIIKLVCLLVPLGFFLQIVLRPARIPLFTGIWFRSNPTVSYPSPPGIHPWAGLPAVHYTLPWPNDPASLAIYCGALLLCLFLVVTVLPRSILVWKEGADR